MPTRWLMVCAVLVLPSIVTAAIWAPEDVRQLIVEPNQGQALTWRTRPAPVDKPLKYVLRDYWDRPLVDAEAGGRENGVALIPFGRPQGYYEVEFPSTGQRFGVVSSPVPAEPRDPFFSVDAAMSWLVKEDALRERLVQVLQRTGIAMARERLSWAQINPARDRFEWDSSARYDKLRQFYAQHDMELLEMFHDSPAWPGRIEKYPDDLVAMARAWTEISRRWHTRWDALEVWNEPDIFFGGNLPADQYVPLVKTLAWVQQAAHTGTPIVGGVLAHDNAQFLDCAATNGMLDCIQVASFHTYGRALGMSELIGHYRPWLAQHGRQDLPLWITECGRPWKRGPDRPPVREDAESALDITMKAIESRVGGIERYFAFVYPFYEENESNFGMLDRRGTPLRSLAAYSRAAAVLSHKRYLGDLRCDLPAIKRARVFADQHDTVAVLYTGAATGSGGVKLDLPVARLEGIDGRKLEVTADGSIPIDDGLVYAWLKDAPQADGKLIIAPESVGWAESARPTDASSRPAASPAPPRKPVSPIVLRYQFDPAVVEATSNGYRLRAETPGEFSLSVRTFNLSTREASVTLKLSFSDASARAQEADPRSLTVPAEGHVDSQWRVDLRDAFALSGQVRVSISATSAAVENILPAVFDLSGDATIEQILNRYPQRMRLAIGDASAWRANIVGHGRMTMQTTTDGHWQLDATFGAGDRWVYPILRLPADLDLSRFTALVVRVRCERPSKVRVLLHEGTAGVCYLTPEPIVPADGRWHAVAIPLSRFAPSAANAPDPNHHLDLDQVKQLSLGLNSDAEQNHLEASDLYAVGPAAGPR